MQTIHQAASCAASSNLSWPQALVYIVATIAGAFVLWVLLR